MMTHNLTARGSGGGRGFRGSGGRGGNLGAEETLKWVGITLGFFVVAFLVMRLACMLKTRRDANRDRTMSERQEIASIKTNPQTADVSKA